MTKFTALCYGLLFMLGALPVWAAATDPVSSAGVYDVRAFGARGDGKALDTAAINQAISAAADAGGGTVRVPAGTYLCYSIHLRSNIVLFLEPGATILAADTPTGGSAGYDAPEPNASDQFQDYGHSHWHNSLLWGENLENVSIVGPGRIYGKGLIRDEGRKNAGDGNKSISLKNCRHVTLRDFSILQGGWFGILATGVDDFTLDNLRIDTNRDGMDIDCCQNVHVSNCSVNSPRDDGICLKSSYGLGDARATKNVTITGCSVSGYDMGTFLDGTYKRKTTSAEGNNRPIGRIKFGTESNGGFQNITMADCVFDYCRGLALETVDGAQLEDVTITNITMRDIVNSPIFLRLGRRMRGPAGTPVGTLRHVTISNIVVDNADARSASLILGIPGHDIEDVHLSNIHIYTKGGGTAAQAAASFPELETGYPEPDFFGATPAYGFAIRHARGIELTDVRVDTFTPDLRPAFVLRDVKDVGFRQCGSVPDAHLDQTDQKNF